MINLYPNTWRDKINMRSVRYMSELTEGQKGVVVSIQTKGEMRRRLHDIGLIEGSRVECIRKSPLGEPIAYLIRGAVIALRKEESSTIMVACKNFHQE